MAEVTEILEAASSEIQALQYEREELRAEVVALQTEAGRLRKRVRHADSWCVDATRLSEAREAFYADWDSAEVEHAVQVADDEDDKRAARDAERIADEAEREEKNRSIDTSCPICKEQVPLPYGRCGTCGDVFCQPCYARLDGPCCPCPVCRSGTVEELKPINSSAGSSVLILS